MGKETLTRRSLIGSASMAALTGCAQTDTKSARALAPTAVSTRINLIFHGVFVFWVGEKSVVVQLPKSNDPKSGKPIHEYRIRWRIQGSEVSVPLPESGTPTEWLGLPAGQRPEVSAQDHMVFSRIPKIKREDMNSHHLLVLPYPESVFAFRYAVAPGPVFASLPSGVRNPIRLAFPIVFSYVLKAGAIVPLTFKDTRNQTTSVKAGSSGATNIHVHADRPKGSCMPGMDHLFVNNNALSIDNKSPGLSYNSLSEFQYTPIFEADPTLGLLGLEASDLKENCDKEIQIVVVDKESRRDTKGWKTDPPDSCFGMWVFE